MIECAHCGTPCEETHTVVDGKDFCCDGCSFVYGLLNKSNLDQYYAIEKSPGIRVTDPKTSQFEFLDNPALAERYLLFQEHQSAKVELYLPAIHCSSCIWLLENLYKLHKGVMRSDVHFANKTATISFNPQEISLRQLAELLFSIGYTPEFVEEKKNSKHNRSLIYKLGIAGFCFGNIMLLSFPEYLSGKGISEEFSTFFAYLNLGLGLPVFFYSASDYFKSAWGGLRYGSINIDVPISLGIAAIFLRSAYEIISGTGPGYIDSMTGLVFFLLVGKWYQSKTYSALSFERDYRSYFPIAITQITEKGNAHVPIRELKKGDRILVRSGELIPADAVLDSEQAFIDYSFVSGESNRIAKKRGDKIFAGGRHEGPSIELVITKEVSQSYLTQLWNQSAEASEFKSVRGFIDRVSKVFTIVVLTIAAATFVYWRLTDESVAILAFTSVLIIACPCALALSQPFTMGHAMRYFGRSGFYLKSADVVERLAATDSVVFDKTGTLTLQKNKLAQFFGEPLNETHSSAIYSITGHSTHPLSQAIHSSLEAEESAVESFMETAGKGIEARLNGKYLIGSAKFVGAPVKHNSGEVHVSYNGKYLGHFSVTSKRRRGMVPLIESLRRKFKVSMLSGDTRDVSDRWEDLFDETNAQFEKDPFEKREFIEDRSANGENILMVGDGLNDSGALKAANVGVATADDVFGFTPAADVIMQGDKITLLPSFIQFAKECMQTLKWSLIISLLYNIIGMVFAVSGALSPIVAAILMPISSITVVAFVTVVTNYKARGLRTAPQT